MYDLVNVLAMIVFITILTFYGNNFGFSKGKAFLMGTIGLAIDYFFIMFLTWVESGFENFGAQNAVRVFVVNPFLIIVYAKVFNVDYRKAADFNAAPGMIWYGLGHYACIFAGCCHGFQYYEGTAMYNIAYALTGTNMLPCQAIEATLALLTGVLLFFLERRPAIRGKGYVYFMMLIIYGIQRFLLEFLRDNNKVIVLSNLKSADGVLGISNLALWALAMVVCGVAFLLAMVQYNRKLEKSTAC